LGQDIIRLETELKARLGVTVLDTATGQRISHRGGERFPMCSTFKVLAGAAVLKQVDGGQEDLGRRIRFDASDVVTYSPVTKERVGGDGMTLAELCEAAITQSDNTAGNLILTTLGGPSAITTFARSLGDTVTRLDRWETELNEATPGDPRDTTTPDAMSANLHALVVQDRLSQRSRDQLIQWLVSNKTGDAKLRAGLPKDWRIGDKTGGGDHGTMNDVAVIWPPERRPVIVTVYMTETKTSFDDRNAAIAELGRSIKSALAA
jgi:beta-lactamase class A